LVQKQTRPAGWDGGEPDPEVILLPVWKRKRFKFADWSKKAPTWSVPAGAALPELTQGIKILTERISCL